MNSNENLNILTNEQLVFDPVKHKYIIPKLNKEYISVTNLMKKYNLIPAEYAKIPEQILKNKAHYGTQIHQALEKFINGDDTQLLIPEVKAFSDYLNSINLSRDDCFSEKIVYNDYYEIAGTLDLQFWNIIADFKTTTTLHQEALMWQLSLYNFLLNPIETNYSSQRLQCFWFSSKGNLEVYNIPLIPYTKLIEFLDNYKQGNNIYVQKIPQNLDDKLNSLINQKVVIDTIKENLKTLTEDYDALKDNIITEMKQLNKFNIYKVRGTFLLSQSESKKLDLEKLQEYLKTQNKNIESFQIRTAVERFKVTVSNAAKVNYNDNKNKKQNILGQATPSKES